MQTAVSARSDLYAPPRPQPHEKQRKVAPHHPDARTRRYEAEETSKEESDDRTSRPKKTRPNEGRHRLGAERGGMRQGSDNNDVAAMPVIFDLRVP